MKEIYSDELASRRRRGWAIIIGTECGVTPPTAYRWPRRALRSSYRREDVEFADDPEGWKLLQARRESLAKGEPT